MPEELFEETEIEVAHGFVMVDPGHGFAVVATKGIDSVLFGPEIDHLPGSIREGIGDNSCEKH